MTAFTLQSGERPLDGYTIEQPIGHGGFGEVYHARSDAGKDVALKLVQRHMEIELRGVGHCLNLKHPNLVTIYDIRPDAAGRQWIIMEYVAGEDLSDVLQRHPEGMPQDEALHWFDGLCQAVEHLHQSGIVHRDLKPANVFDDAGTVKVGDYGLSKFITASRRSAQTQSVGTVHYMAPEVGSGRYGREVDVYAVGIILYEMLTGRVPFEGQTPAEILMKHLTATPDLKVLPPAFQGVLARMLAKNPNDRYGSLAAALADLKVRLTDAANAAAAGEQSEYPAYDESIISRPGVSDWLEAPFAMLGGLAGAGGGSDSGRTAPAATHDRRGGVISDALRRRPLLSAFCAFLVLIVVVGSLVSLSGFESGQSMTFLFLFAVGPSVAVAAFGFLLRYESDDGSITAAWRRRPLLSALCAFLVLLPLVGGLNMLGAEGDLGKMNVFFVLAIAPAALVAAVGFLMRTGGDQPVENVKDSAHIWTPARPPVERAKRLPAEFQPTVIGDVSAREEPGEPTPPAPPRDRAVVLSELAELDQDWHEYRERYLAPTKGGGYDVPRVEETRIAIWIACGFCGLLAVGGVLLGISGTDPGFVIMMLLGAGVLAGVMILPLLGQYKTALIYPRSERNYRSERRKLLVELGEHGDDVARFFEGPATPDGNSARGIERSASMFDRQDELSSGAIGAHDLPSANRRRMGIVEALLCFVLGVGSIYLTAGLPGARMMVFVALGGAVLVLLALYLFNFSGRAWLGLLLGVGLLVTFGWSSLVSHDSGHAIVPGASSERTNPPPGKNPPPEKNPPVGTNSQVGSNTSLNSQAGRPPVSSRFDPDHGVFHCLYPDGWNVADINDGGQIAARFDKDGAQIHIRQIPPNEIQRIAAMFEASGNDDAIRAHLHTDDARGMETAAVGLENYRENGDESLQGAMGEIPVAESHGWNNSGDKVHGLRATLLQGDLGLLVVCRSPERDWPHLKPVFEQVIRSISAGRKNE